MRRRPHEKSASDPKQTLLCQIYDAFFGNQVSARHRVATWSNVIVKWLVVLLILAASDSVFASQECDAANFDGHAQQIACEIRQTQSKSHEVDVALANVKAANVRFEKIPGTKPGLFTSRIDDDQRLWNAWIAENCRLQGDATMGTAGADVEQQCLQEGYSQRIQMLNQLAQTLGS